MAYITKRLVKLCKIYCDIWHRLTWNVCTDGRTLRHNLIFWDGWFTKFSYPWCSAARPLRARGSSAIKVNRLRTIEEKSLKLQQCSFSLSHLSDKTYNYDQNNEKPRREGQKRFPWSLVYLKFLNKTCTSNVFAKFLRREFTSIRWFSRRKSASSVWLNVRLHLLNKWCHGHAQYVIQSCLDG